MIVGDGIKWGALAAVLLLASGCMASRNDARVNATAAALSVPKAGNAPSLLNGPDTSVAFRKRMGDRYAAIILEGARKSRDRAMQRRLNLVVSALAAQVENAAFPYKVHLLEDEKPNAFTSGGGHLFVTTGLIGVLESEGQIAMVLAHEMAHNELAHVVKGAHGRGLAERAATFSDEVLDKQLGLTWIGSGFDFLVTTGLNKYTREQEDEADVYGLKYIVGAGYDPYVAPRAVRALSQGATEPSEFANFFKGRHPTAKMRIWRFNNLIKAHFYNVDITTLRRSSAQYDKLSARYRKST